MNKKEFKELDREQMIIAFNQLKDDYSSLFDELEQEKEKNKELYEIKYIASTFIERPMSQFSVGEFRYKVNNSISKDKIKEKMEQTKKVYDEEMKPYMIEVGNGEKILNITYLSKKEKEELINKRNCLLVQIKAYEMLLEDK